MSADPGGVGGRLLNACLALLIGAMALAGAITILESIWVELCVVVTSILTIAGIGWFIHRRIGRW
jgi:hypothetical protein